MTNKVNATRRRLMQPKIHRRHIENYGRSMTDIAAQRAETWNDGAVLDLEQEMRGLALQVIVKILFGMDRSEIVNRIGTSLLQARFEDEDGEDAGGMSDEQVRDEVVTLYFAGHDTTAATLTWTLYLHPAGRPMVRTT